MRKQFQMISAMLSVMLSVLLILSLSACDTAKEDGQNASVSSAGYAVNIAAYAAKGEIPEIKNMVPFAPFDFYIKRKLYIHNMGHATCAYLGDLLGLEYIYQSIDVPEVRIVVQNAMIESAMALHK